MLPFLQVLPYVFGSVFNPLINVCLYQTMLPLKKHVLLHYYSLHVGYIVRILAAYFDTVL
jgi:hypothetical protein